MVSVIIPTYNRAASIEKSIESVIGQSYRDIEVIIVDDGSTDDTEQIVKRIRDERIRYYYQENSGACSARNVGIDLAKGDYIAFQDSDDVWHPNKLNRQMKMAQKTNADILFCQLQRCNGDTTFTAVLPDIDRSGLVEIHDLVIGISTQTLLMKEVVARDIKFDETAPRFQDLEWLLRAVRKYSVYGMKEILVDVYFSENSITFSSPKLLSGIELIQKKNPYLSKDAPKVNRALQQMAMNESLYRNLRGEKDYKEYFNLGRSLSNSVKDVLKYDLKYILKYTAMRTGIYNKIKNLS